MKCTIDRPSGTKITTPSAFVAQLISVLSLKHELLYEQLIKLIEIIHQSDGFVFLAMSDNLRANISCFQKFHTQFGSSFEYAVTASL